MPGHQGADTDGCRAVRTADVALLLEAVACDMFVNVEHTIVAFHKAHLRHAKRLVIDEPVKNADEMPPPN